MEDISDSALRGKNPSYQHSLSLEKKLDYLLFILFFFFCFFFCFVPPEINTRFDLGERAKENQIVFSLS